MIIKPVRLQLRRVKGFDLQALSHATNGLEAIVITRGPGRKWGNPFSITFCKSWFSLDGKKAHVKAVELHRQWLDRTLIEPRTWCDQEPPTEDEIRIGLRGRNVACTCGLDECCHGDTLLEIANR